MRRELPNLNKQFCEGAESLRYINRREGEKGGKYQFFSNDIVPTPFEGSWLRSVKFDNLNSYLFVLDIDGKGIDRKLLRGVYGLYDTIYNYLHIKPLLKASGSKGAQLIFKLNFSNDIDTAQCAEHMRNLAYSLWKLSSYQTRQIILFDDVPGIDLAMFKRNQMVRSFCKHLGSDNYSVPFEYGESPFFVKRRMKLTKPLLQFDGFPEMDFDESLILHTYEKKTYLPKVTLEKTMKIIRLYTEAERDSIYKRLPYIIKRLVSAGHIEHDLKWPVISYLHIFECMSEKEILDWLFEQSNWDDLTKVEVTTYHINWTCNWARNIMFKDPGSGTVKLPLPAEIVRALNKERFDGKGRHNDEISRNGAEFHKKIRQRFLDSLESEQFSTQQI